VAKSAGVPSTRSSVCWRRRRLRRGVGVALTAPERKASRG
jgi:hypothetical protein